jgi:hypothetical protein
MPAVNWTNITDFGQLPGEANTASGGLFWVSTFYMLWIIIMLLLIGYGFEVAILVASFLMLIVGLLIVYAGLMAWQHLLTVIGILLFMFLYIIWSSAKVRQ